MPNTPPSGDLKRFGASIADRYVIEREIRLRHAICATRMNVMLQFLVEAVVLCLTGGVFVIASGLLFGAWPASRAAALDPITARRYE